MTHLNDTLTTFLSILLSFFLDLFNTNLITLLLVSSGFLHGFPKILPLLIWPQVACDVH